MRRFEFNGFELKYLVDRVRAELESVSGAKACESIIKRHRDNI